MNSELLRLVDSISRDKNIEKENVFLDLEAAMSSAMRKEFLESENVVVSIDRHSGQFQASVDGKNVEIADLGRIAAQTAKQVMIQRLREDERNSIFEEFSTKVGTVVTGTVERYDGRTAYINIGRAQGLLPRSEQLPGESHEPGGRVRAMILDVREAGNLVKILLTRTHPDFVRRLFEVEVPEVAERIIDIRALAREPGYRTKVAVTSIDTKVDAVGACVGVRGSRIRNIVDELGGEKIDIVRWNESSQVLISNALKPAVINEVFLCFELGRATVVVNEDQLSLAIGKRGQNVRLTSRLTGWDVDILTPAGYDKSIDLLEKTLKGIGGVDDVLLDKMLAMGMISVGDVEAVGEDPLMEELGIEQPLAHEIVERAAIAQEQFEAEKKEQRARDAQLKAAEAAAGGSAEASENGQAEAEPPPAEAWLALDGAAPPGEAETPAAAAEEASPAVEKIGVAWPLEASEGVDGETQPESDPGSSIAAPEGSLDDALPGPDLTEPTEDEPGVERTV